MKRLLLPVLFVLAGCSSESPSPPAATTPAATASVVDPARGGARHGTWLRAESRKEDRPIAWEYRDDYVVKPERARLIVVSLGHEDAFDGNTPASRQRDYDEREQRLREALKDRAELVATLDWRQQHDWFFYAAADVVREDVESAAGERSFSDLQIALEDDPEFDFYRTLRQRVHGGEVPKP